MLFRSFARYDGTAWTAARTIRSGRDFFVNWADFPSLAVHPGGALAVHWLQRQGDGKGYSYDVRIARSTDGGATWSEPFMPHGDRGRSEKGFVTMWPDGDGFGAAWLDGRNADKAVNGGAPVDVAALQGQLEVLAAEQARIRELLERMAPDATPGG